MTTEKYKGFDVLRSNKGRTVQIRRHYSSKVHGGFPAPYSTFTAESVGQASAQIEEYVADRATG